MSTSSHASTTFACRFQTLRGQEPPWCVLASMALNTLLGQWNSWQCCRKRAKWHTGKHTVTCTVEPSQMIPCAHLTWFGTEPIGWGFLPCCQARGAASKPNQPSAMLFLLQFWEMSLTRALLWTVLRIASFRWPCPAFMIFQRVSWYVGQELVHFNCY